MAIRTATWLILMWGFLPGSAQARASINDVRVWHAPDHSRVVLEISQPVQYQLFTLPDPDRVVVDVDNAGVTGQLSQSMEGSVILRGMRHAKRGEANTRLVFDLRETGKPKSFLLKPNEKYGHRLVIDFYPDAETKPPPRKNTSESSIARRDKFLVVIDPGHGGEDPGAIGPGGAREKDVVLQISRRLAAAIDRHPNMEAILTRDGDYFIKLRDRMEMARKKQADFFVSIHANSYKSPRVKGAAIYSISERGASSAAARALAERENASDMLGGVTLDDKDDLLASVLVDLSQSATLDSSLRAARFLLREVEKVIPLHKKEPQLAGFAVLKAPDVPALLVETAFISNPEEERKLKNADFQEKLAQSLVAGLQGYMYSEPGLAQRLRLAKQATSHVVQPGDTLSDLARRYGVPLDRLRAANPALKTYLRVGDTLRIPVEVGG